MEFKLKVFIYLFILFYLAETVWRQADKYKVPRIIYINKLDREGSSIKKCVYILFLI